MLPHLHETRLADAVQLHLGQHRPLDSVRQGTVDVGVVLGPRCLCGGVPHHVHHQQPATRSVQDTWGGGWSEGEGSEQQCDKLQGD